MVMSCSVGGRGVPRDWGYSAERKRQDERFKSVAIFNFPFSIFHFQLLLSSQWRLSLTTNTKEAEEKQLKMEN
jgi:hypothetical protein